MSIAVDSLQCRIENVIDLYRQEGELTAGEVVGVLEMIKLNIWAEANEDD